MPLQAEVFPFLPSKNLLQWSGRKQFYCVTTLAVRVEKENFFLFFFQISCTSCMLTTWLGWRIFFLSILLSSSHQHLSFSEAHANLQAMTKSCEWNRRGLPTSCMSREPYCFGQTLVLFLKGYGRVSKMYGCIPQKRLAFPPC